MNFLSGEGRLIDLADFVRRLSAIRTGAPFALGRPLRDAVGDKIEAKFSPSARGLAAGFIWPKIQTQFDAAQIGYDELSGGWSRFEEIREGAKGGVLDLAQARLSATRYGWFSIVVSIASMAIATIARITQGAETQVGPAFFIALVVSLVAFIPHAFASAKLKKATLQSALASRYGANDEKALVELERNWESRQGDLQSLGAAFDQAVIETSAIRSVRKATAYDAVVDAESEVLRRSQMANISYTEMMGAQAAIAGALTVEKQRAADQKYRSAAANWRDRQTQLAEAEARLRLAKTEYEGL